MSSAAALPAVAILPTAIVATPAIADYAPDPIFAVIEVYQVLAKRNLQAYLELDRAEGRFRDKFGLSKPDALDKERRTELTAIWKQFDGVAISTHEDVDLFGRKFSLPPERVVELHGGT